MPAESSGPEASSPGLDQDEAVRLVLAQQPLLLGFARAIVGRRDMAEDAFQDLVMLVMRKHASIPNQESVPGWTRRALRFIIFNRLQHMSRELPTMDDELIRMFEAEYQPPPGRPETGGAEAYLEALAKCRETLGERSRELLELRYEKSLSGQQIAEHLGRPLNTVYVTLSRLHRALENCIRLRLRVKDD